jgi:hypothetical protein
MKNPKKFQENSKIEFLLLRQKLGFSRYVKTSKRDARKKEILLNLALKQIEEREKNDYIQTGPGRRRIRLS